MFPFKFQSLCWCWLRPDWELCSGFGWHVSYNPLRIGWGWKFFSLMTRTITNSMSFENVLAGFLRSPNMDTNTDNICRPYDAAKTHENKSNETSFFDYYFVTPNNAFLSALNPRHSEVALNVSFCTHRHHPWRWKCFPSRSWLCPWPGRTVQWARRSWRSGGHAAAGR